MGGTRSFAAWQWSLAAFRARLSSWDCQRCRPVLFLNSPTRPSTFPPSMSMQDWRLWWERGLLLPGNGGYFRSPLFRLPTSSTCLNMKLFYHSVQFQIPAAQEITGATSSARFHLSIISFQIKRYPSPDLKQMFQILVPCTFSCSLQNPLPLPLFSQ